MGYVALVDEEGQEWLCSCALFHPDKRSETLVYACTSHLYGETGSRVHRMHCMVWERYHGPMDRFPKGFQIDHINGNGLDNRKENLRLATRRQNMANRGRDCDKESSQYKGVFLSGKGPRYEAVICSSGHKYRIGTFACERDAAIAYNLRARELFGEFARINVVGQTQDDERRVLALILNPKFIGLLSRYRGVGRSRNGKKWRATIVVNDRQIYLGTHDTEEAAALAYNAAALKHWGIKAKLNVIPTTIP